MTNVMKTVGRYLAAAMIFVMLAASCVLAAPTGREWSSRPAVSRAERVRSETVSLAVTRQECSRDATCVRRPRLQSVTAGPSQNPAADAAATTTR